MIKAETKVHLMDSDYTDGYLEGVFICETHLGKEFSSPNDRFTFEIDKVTCDFCLRLIKLGIFI